MIELPPGSWRTLRSTTLVAFMLAPYGPPAAGESPAKIISPPVSLPGFRTGMPKIRLRTGGVGLPAASCAAI